MRRHRSWLLARRTALVIVLLGLPPATRAVEPVGEALTGGTVRVDVRYRYEFVDQDGFGEDARASTVRLRLGYETGSYHGLFAYGEFEDVNAVGSEQYDSTSNGLTRFPVVVDPEGAEVNQVYLGYRGLEGATFLLGRQRIILDNHRFIGNVGWRQNEQTFDALSARLEVDDRLSLFYGHLNNVNRIFGEDHPSLSELNLDADLLNVSYEFPAGTLIGYAYLLELQDTPAASHKDVGVRFRGRHALTDDLRLLYTAEYADQSDYRDAPSSVDASYRLAELGLGIKRLTVKAGYELLEGDGAYAFQTPLATLHAFNGWADKFLVTPLDGLRDLYLSVGATLAGVRLLGVYHDFSADDGGADYGTELDLLVAKTFHGKYTAGLKYAGYSADGFATDTDKLWVTLQVRF
ncbi:MAG: alginate export family protein [Acidobacteriota bacterium]